MRVRFGSIMLLALLACSGPDGDPQPLPNVVLVLVDDLRSDALGSAGHPFFESPCIDRIGEEGAFYRDAFVVTSLCSPSRATVLTGLHTAQHRVNSIYTELDTSIPTVATTLEDQGYQTAFVGKSHLNHDGAPLPGFDRWYSFAGQGSFVNPTLNIDGVSVQVPGHMTDLLTTEAVRFLRFARRDEPFFLVLSHLAVHGPWTVQQRFVGLYADETISPPESWYDDLSDQPDYLSCRQLLEFDGIGFQRYYELLAGVEESTCALLAVLTELGELDDTLLIFTSDNGYLLGEHRLGDKRSAYEESIRIPLLIRYPRWFASGVRVANSLALNLDLAPTIHDAVGLAPEPSMGGWSLRLMATGEERRDRFLYSYDYDPSTLLSRCTPSIRAIRTLDHIFIENDSPSAVDELYELRSDPVQLENRVSEPGLAALVDSLRLELAALRTQFGDD